MTPTDADQFLGLSLSPLTLGGALDAVFAGIDAPFTYIVTPNVDHVIRLDRAGIDADAAAFAAAYDHAELILCDSRVLARLARLSGRRLSVVPGSDLTRALLSDPRIVGRRVAIVGGSATLPAQLAARMPGVDFVQHRPPMGVLRDAAAMAAIEAFVAGAAADVTLFAIGTPQGEIAAHRCRRGGRSRGVGLSIGASLDFIVGDQRRAPSWVQRAGFEWAFRLANEPRRLWRRYLVEGPRVFAIWARRGRG